MHSENFWLILAAVIVAVATVVGAILYTIAFHKDQGPAPQAVAAANLVVGEAEEEIFEVEQELSMVIFLQSPGDPYRLVPMQRTVYNTISLSQQAGQVLQQLVDGPRQGEPALAAMPRGTKLRRFYLSRDGVAYAFFSEQIAEPRPAGAAAELMTAYAIVNTLCVNFPTIQAVQIVVEGRNDSTLAGHLDITQPLELDPTYFAVEYHPPAKQNEEELVPEQDVPEEEPGGVDGTQTVASR